MTSSKKMIWEMFNPRGLLKVEYILMACGLVLGLVDYEAHLPYVVLNFVLTAIGLLLIGIGIFIMQVRLMHPKH